MGADGIVELAREWFGFESLRPMQERAIELRLAGRDALVVMPTGGGKSLCYQLPPLRTQRLTVVVSPLIALMKDQVDGLRVARYPAAALHSGQSFEEQREIERAVAAGQVLLLYVAPERLCTDRCLGLIARGRVEAFAIDEAHCISQWGHDFRPEYRRLADLRERFPQASVHAFTATATEKVRADIVTQLALRDRKSVV